MPNAAPAIAPTPVPAIDPAELKAREDWFTQTPDPWRRIVVLEFGADRTFASTIERMVVEAEPAQRRELEDRLIEVLGRPELTDAGLQFVCRMLALVGTAACVARLRPFLESPHTADSARLALDAIGDPAVDAAYRDALGRLRGPAQIGVIGSMGMRGDRTALEPLRVIAADANAASDVRQAAERAIARLERKG